MGLPLEGIKVLELAQQIGSPFCTSMMADFGADVINIEPRNSPRGRLEESVLGKKGGPPDYSALHRLAGHFALQRGKRSMTLDIRKPEGKEIVCKLAKNSDVFTQNFRPGVIERLGLGYDVLSKDNPRLIYLSITGFGPKGPWANRPGIELIFQGYSGYMALQGPDAEGIPRYTAGAPTDMNAGVYSFVGLMLALFERERSGRGQKVDTSNLACALSILSFHLQGFLMGRKAAEGVTMVPFRGFRTKDGFMAIGIPGDQFWPNFCKALDIQHIEKEPAFATNTARVKNVDAVESLIQSILEQKTTAEWLKKFEEADALGGPIYTPEQVFQDPQVLANDMIVPIDHPVYGKVNMIGIPVRLSRTPGKVRRPPSMFSQHTEEILKEIGYTQDQIQELRKNEVI